MILILIFIQSGLYIILHKIVWKQFPNKPLNK